MSKSESLGSVSLRARMVREAERARDEAVVHASGRGASLREIGEAAGLSHTQIRRILERME